MTYLVLSINMDPVEILTVSDKGAMCEFLHKHCWYFAGIIASGFVIFKLLKTIIEAADALPRGNKPYYRYHGTT